jgi:hypothetical protein
MLERVIRHALNKKRWNAALLQPGGEGMLARYIDALCATLCDLAPQLSEDECEIALINWLDDRNVDPSLDFHSYAVAWSSARRSRSTSRTKRYSLRHHRTHREPQSSACRRRGQACLLEE